MKRLKLLSLLVAGVVSGCATGLQFLEAELVEVRLVDMRDELEPSELAHLFSQYDPQELLALQARLAKGEPADPYEFIKVTFTVGGDFGKWDLRAIATFCKEPVPLFQSDSSYAQPSSNSRMWAFYILNPHENAPHAVKLYDLRRPGDDICGSLGSGNYFNLREANFIINRDEIREAFKD